jgi:hypothetical protein
MSKANDDARKELDKILAGLMTDKNMKKSDKKSISNSLRPVTEETKKRISEGNKTESVRKKKLEAHLGKKRSEKTKQRISDYAKNRSISHKEKLKESLTGFKHSEETKKKMKEAAKHKPPRSKETIQKQADKVRGVPKSPEHIEAIKLGQAKVRSNTEWSLNMKEARRKPCVTPLGIFSSLEEAGLSHNRHRNWVRDKIKNKTQGFYYITKEEYILLTGKDPRNEP